jgi:hypothetical protein
MVSETDDAIRVITVPPDQLLLCQKKIYCCIVIGNYSVNKGELTNFSD